jgi:hypothetical protein
LVNNFLLQKKTSDKIFERITSRHFVESTQKLFLRYVAVDLHTGLLVFEHFSIEDLRRQGRN